VTVRYFVRLTLVVMMSLTVYACASPALKPGPAEVAEVSRFQQGLVWQLDHPSLPTVYLVGTQHVPGPGVSAVVRTAVGLLPRVELVATEVGVDPPDDYSAIVWDYFSSDQPPFLDQQLDPRLWRALSRQGAELGISSNRLRQLSPSGATILLRSEVEVEQTNPLGQGVDARLAAIAQIRELPVVGLETHVESLRSVFQIADWMDRWMGADLVVVGGLLDMISVGKNGAAVTRRASGAGSAAYAREDIGYFVRTVDAPTGATAPAVSELLAITRDHIITDRNYRFVDRLMGRVDEGPMLVAVGAGPLAGPEGMLELLEGRGFQATRIQLGN
jgi:hypothetical protein